MNNKTFHATGIFQYSQKTSENRFPDDFKGYRKRPMQKQPPEVFY